MYKTGNKKTRQQNTDKLKNTLILENLFLFPKIRYLILKIGPFIFMGKFNNFILTNVHLVCIV